MKKRQTARSKRGRKKIHRAWVQRETLCEVHTRHLECVQDVVNWNDENAPTCHCVCEEILRLCSREQVKMKTSLIPHPFQTEA